MYEAVFRIEGREGDGVPTAGLDATVELWCNDHSDLLHVSGPDGPAVVAYFEERVGVAERIEEGAAVLVITDDCLKASRHDHVERYLARHDCLLVPPLRYERGARLCRVLALDGESLTAFYRDLLDDHAVTVETKREVGTVTPDAPLLTVDGMLPELSPRQREAFLAAYEAGYYEIPRRTTTTELAERMGVERRTAEEHLRRAENKFVAALVEYL